MTNALCPPILFIVFNRPGHAAATLEAICEAKPPRLYVACDGPRLDREGEAALVAECRTLFDQVTWDCEVRTLFRDTNLGSASAIPEAIDWFFDHETAGIILEDDCWPAQDFFPFCATLLEKYSGDPMIGWINGCNYGFTDQVDSDYLFTNYPTSWGWASWREVWQAHNRDMRDWSGRVSADAPGPGCNSSLVHRIFWKSTFNWAFRFPNWDYRIVHTFMVTKKLACMPAANLIRNHGFGADATHTRNLNDPLARLTTGEISFPLRAPDARIASEAGNSHLESHLYRIGPKEILRRQMFLRFPRLMTKLKKLLHG